MAAAATAGRIKPSTINSMNPGPRVPDSLSEADNHIRTTANLPLPTVALIPPA